MRPWRWFAIHGPADNRIAHAGGVRVLLETDGLQDLVVTMVAAHTLQPFPNELDLIQLSAQQVKGTLEEAVSNWKDGGNSDGSHQAQGAAI